MQAALGEIQGAAGPMHESFTWNQILEDQPRLLDQRAVRLPMIKAEPLFCRLLDAWLVFWMATASIHLHAKVNLAHPLIALVHAFNRASNLPHIAVIANMQRCDRRYRVQSI